MSVQKPIIIDQADLAWEGWDDPVSFGIGAHTSIGRIHRSVTTSQSETSAMELHDATAR